MKKSFKFISSICAAVLAFGVGMALKTTSSSKIVKEVDAATSNVVNGNKRFNVFVHDDNKWVFNDGYKLFTSGLSDSLKDFDFDTPDTDFGEECSYPGVRKITLGDGTYYVATISLGTSFSTTWWNNSIERHNGSSYYNKHTLENGAVWTTKLNSVQYWGDGIKNFGYYYKVALHTGLSLGNIEYKFVNNGSYLPSDPESPTGYVFDGWYTNPELTSAYTRSDLSGDINLYAKYKHATGRYIVGDFGSCSWGVENAVYMSKINSFEYSAEIELEYGDQLQIANYDGTSLSSHYGYLAMTPRAAAYPYFGDCGTSNHNIVCYATGTYTFYFTDNTYDESYKISCAYTESLTAQHLAAKLMSYGAHDPSSGDTGACRDGRFTTCKTMYLGLSVTEQAIFIGYETSEVDQFKHAYQRYVAWAAANGQKPWENGAVGSSIFTVFGSDSDSSIATIVIVVVSLVSLTAIGGFFYYKKRKQN